MPRLLLSHNPDVAEEPELKEAGRRVDLMLSGHTHGGQVRLPLLGAPITNSAYGKKYARGLVQGPACPVYICRGIGVSGCPLRLGSFRGIGVSGCPLRLGSFPEIALFQLHSA
jgi:predicted MPP superfamily phosphohydrolase